MSPDVVGSERQELAGIQTRQLKEVLLDCIRAFVSAIDARDHYTCGHSLRVARIAVTLGQELQLPESKLSRLYLAGLLHDVGKIGVSDALLNKPGKLTPNEFDQIKLHVNVGVSILKQIKRFGELIPAVRHHHERIDGRGYPDGLSGDQISFEGRVLAVADGFDAMMNDRPYRPKLVHEGIGVILRDGAGKQWDERVVQAALARWDVLASIEGRGMGESLRRAVATCEWDEGSPRSLARQF
jgi:putative nucleotidyltransferase with HDIG domain